MSNKKVIAVKISMLIAEKNHLQEWKDEVNGKGYLDKHQYSRMQFQGLPKKNYTCKELRMK